MAPTVGAYQLDVRLGATGSTEVWAAHAGNQSSQPVAVKLFKDGAEANANPTAIFPDEARAAQTLDHEALVKTFEFARGDLGHYLVMELVHGPSLAALMPRLAASNHPPFSAALVAHIGARLADALDHAANHAQMDGLRIRLVHRHLSPHNVLIGTDGRVRLADLGVAPSDVHPDPAGLPRTIRGKPGYLAPEQISGAPVDERADLFSLGVVLYECATLKTLFAGADSRATLLAVLEQKPKPLHEVILGFPRTLGLLVARLLEKDPAARYGSAAEVRDELIAIGKQLLAYSRSQSTLQEMVKACFPEGSFELRVAAQPAQSGPPLGGSRHDPHEEATVPGGGRPLPADGELPAPKAREGQSGPWPAATGASPLAPEAIEGAKKELEKNAPTTVKKDSFADKALEQVNLTIEMPERRRWLMIAGGVLVLLLILRAVVAGRAGSADSKLRAAYETGNYKDTVTYFTEHMGDFKYPGTAFELASDARARGIANGTLAAPENPAPAPDVAGAEPAAGASGVANDAPAALPTEGEGGEPDALLQPKKPAADLVLPVEVPEPANLNKNLKKAFKGASLSYRQAAEAMSVKEYDKAERLLMHCLEQLELPLCHLRLAALYTTRGSEAKSVRHYKRFLGFDPKNPQAGEIQRRIQQAEGR